jgi:hypothetical protein
VARKGIKAVEGKPQAHDATGQTVSSPLYCMNCTQSGRAFWNAEKSEPVLAGVSDTFYIRPLSSNPHRPEIVCRSCGKIHKNRMP